AGFSGENHRSIERSALLATLSNPFRDGSSCGVSGIVPSVMLYAVTAQKSAAGGSGGRCSLEGFDPSRNCPSASRAVNGYLEPAFSVRMTIAGADAYATWKYAARSFTSRSPSCSHSDVAPAQMFSYCRSL